MISLNPKQDFLKTELAKSHFNLVVKPEIIHALQMALNEMIVRQPGADSVSKAWDSHSKLEGAKEFIAIFLNLSTPDQPFRSPPSKSLSYGHKPEETNE